MIRKIVITQLISLGILFISGIVLSVANFFLDGESIKGSLYIFLLAIGNLFLPCFFCVIVYQFILSKVPNTPLLANLLAQIFFATVIFIVTAVLVLMIEPYLYYTSKKSFYTKMQEAAPALGALSIVIPIAHYIFKRRFDKTGT